MSLDTFFNAVGPYFGGAAGLEQTVAALGGDVDAARLGLYGHFCNVHRREILEGVYPVTRAALAPELWKTLFDRYFRTHPTTHWDLNANAAAFPEFVRAQPEAPAWAWELADVEWWHFAAFVAADEKVPVRVKDQLHPTLMLRPYAFDVLRTYQEHGGGNGDEPCPGPVVMRIHRDKQHNTVAALATPAQLVVVKSIVEGVALAAAARESGVKSAELRKARNQLVKAGAVVAGRPRR